MKYYCDESHLHTYKTFSLCVIIIVRHIIWYLFLHIGLNIMKRHINVSIHQPNTMILYAYAYELQ